LPLAPRSRHALTPQDRDLTEDYRCFADGTSRQEIDPAFFQPSLNSHVLGWYTTSGSYVSGPRHKNGSSPYSAQPGNIAALENQSILHVDIGVTRSSWCFLQLFMTYDSACRAWRGDVMISAW